MAMGSSDNWPTVVEHHPAFPARGPSCFGGQAPPSRIQAVHGAVHVASEVQALHVEVTAPRLSKVLQCGSAGSCRCIVPLPHER